MGSAWVVCHLCKTRVKLGDERWKKNRPVCSGCYSALQGRPENVDKHKGRSKRIDPEELGL